MGLDINRDDVKKFIYFICSISQEKMYGDLASKSDLIGGVFDRWINIISEGVFFDKYFLPIISDQYKLVSDFYRYKPLDIGIAPDLVGVRFKDIVIPFATLTDVGWAPYKTAPQIEIKTFKEDQYLVSLRNQHYEGKYLVLLQMALDPAYLVPFLSKDIFDDSVFSQLQMSDKVFIGKDFPGSIHSVEPIIRKDKLGTLELIKITTANDFMECCDLCGPKTGPQYIKDIEKTTWCKSTTRPRNLSFFGKIENRLFRFSKRWYSKMKKKNCVTLAWKIGNPEEIEVISFSQSSVVIFAINDSKINEFSIASQTYYRIKFGYLDRSGKNSNEYFMHKSIVSECEDTENELLIKTKEHIENEKRIRNL